MDSSGKLAEIIYYGGDVVTMNDDQPSQARLSGIEGLVSKI